ncbi:GL11978 [Drosophila persimilis]|uniref:GL11978 n=1 Tax=Drosophila persimilis TaxID=7234 RepID=B4GLT3_DROPE|nr:GL11978 [Drosophila persimilis]
MDKKIADWLEYDREQIRLINLELDRLERGEPPSKPAGQMQTPFQDCPSQKDQEVKEEEKKEGQQEEQKEEKEKKEEKNKMWINNQ